MIDKKKLKINFYNELLILKDYIAILIKDDDRLVEIFNFLEDLKYEIFEIN